MAIPDPHFSNIKLAKIYDLQNPWAEDSEFYLNNVSAHESIIDLGCGTGTLAIALANKGHEVIAVDPAKAMLQIAKSKTNSEKVNWVCSTSQDFISPKLVDKIFMTGHAFQVLLTDEDILETFKAMFKNLKVGGKAIFETRNPRIEPWKNWTQNKTTQIFEMDGHPIKCFVELKNIDGQFITFDNVFEFPHGKEYSESKLRFSKASEVTRLAEIVGFKVESIHGNWDESAFCEDSKEAIFTLRK